MMIYLFVYCVFVKEFDTFREWNREVKLVEMNEKLLDPLRSSLSIWRIYFWSEFKAGKSMWDGGSLLSRGTKGRALKSVFLLRFCIGEALRWFLLLGLNWRFCEDWAAAIEVDDGTSLVDEHSWKWGMTIFKKLNIGEVYGKNKCFTRRLWTIKIKNDDFSKITCKILLWLPLFFHSQNDACQLANNVQRLLVPQTQ